LFVCSGIDAPDCSETVLVAPYEAELAPVGMGEMFSSDRLMGTPAGGPALKASGRLSVVMGTFPPAGFKASGTSLALTSSKSSSSPSSSSDLFHSSSLKSESSSCVLFCAFASSNVLKLKAGDLLRSGEYGASAALGAGTSGGCSSKGVVGYGGFALDSGAGTSPDWDCGSSFRSTIVAGGGDVMEVVVWCAAKSPRLPGVSGQERGSLRVEMWIR
jgi:hypothetical protein